MSPWHIDPEHAMTRKYSEVYLLDIDIVQIVDCLLYWINVSSRVNEDYIRREARQKSKWIPPLRRGRSPRNFGIDSCMRSLLVGALLFTSFFILQRHACARLD